MWMKLMYYHIPVKFVLMWLKYHSYLNNHANVPNKWCDIFMYEWKENEFQSKLFKCNLNA